MLILLYSFVKLRNTELMNYVNHRITQEIFWSLHRAGKTREDSMEQLYCGKCDKFLADRFVEGTCPLKECAYPDARGDQVSVVCSLLQTLEIIPHASGFLEAFCLNNQLYPALIILDLVIWEIRGAGQAG